ncbi:BrnT family toxin [Candidatus Daviesbacteria bacterium]|nr:BrnT family toxin [Candidatus Daviesbacteria bacterium]
MNIVIEQLIVEKSRYKHIAKHHVKVSEAREVIDENYVYIKGRENKLLLIGKTKAGRFLTVVIGSRRKKGVYGLVTARPASREERSFYREFVLQTVGEQNGKN